MESNCWSPDQSSPYCFIVSSCIKLFGCRFLRFLFRLIWRWFLWLSCNKSRMNPKIALISNRNPLPSTKTIGAIFVPEFREFVLHTTKVWEPEHRLENKNTFGNVLIWYLSELALENHKSGHFSKIIGKWTEQLLMHFKWMKRNLSFCLSPKLGNIQFQLNWVNLFVSTPRSTVNHSFCMQPTVKWHSTAKNAVNRYHLFVHHQQSQYDEKVWQRSLVMYFSLVFVIQWVSE